jgi:transposase InsO family protein
MENGYIESFYGKFREECLNEHWFLTLDDARETIENWRIDYNRVRPYSALAYLTRRNFETQMAMQMWKAKNASHIRTATAAASLSRC